MRLIFYIVAIVFFSSCSASWHIRKAIKKDPSLFDTTRTIVIRKAEIPASEFSFNIDSLMKTRFSVIEIPREYEMPVTGDLRKDTIYVRLRLSSQDSLQIQAEVDCPDPEVITETKITTITLEPTFWQKARHALVLLLVMVAIYGLIRLFR